jgi:hypothetical protein
MGRPLFLGHSRFRNHSERRERGEANLRRTRFELRPRLREKGLTHFDAKSRRRITVGVSLRKYRNCEQGRAPKLLHVGRSSPRTRKPVAVDPGSKGKRVAWKTSFGLEAGRDMKRTMTLCIDLPVFLPGDGRRAGSPFPNPERRHDVHLIRTPADDRRSLSGAPV